MLVSLDYDGTYTLDPEFWDDFIATIRTRGHKVYCVTMRYPGVEGNPVRDALVGRVDEIIFTGRRAKLEYLSYLNINPDIWIDDQPHFIYMDAIK